MDLDLGCDFGAVDHVDEDVALDLAADFGRSGSEDIEIALPVAAVDIERPCRAGVILGTDGSVLQGGIGGHLGNAQDQQVNDFTRLAAAWNTTQRQVGNQVPEDKGVAAHPATTSLISLLRLAFVKQAPKRFNNFRRRIAPLV